jgi:hypothetical protein
MLLVPVSLKESHVLVHYDILIVFILVRLLKLQVFLRVPILGLPQSHVTSNSASHFNVYRV